MEEKLDEREKERTINKRIRNEGMMKETKRGRVMRERIIKERVMKKHIWPSFGTSLAYRVPKKRVISEI